ncbi:MAG: DUF2380 domain-containing protein [Thermodesulfobacteriota bacterium]
MRIRPAFYFLLPAMAALIFLSASSGFCQSGNRPTCAVLKFLPDEASTEQYESRYITNRYAQFLSELDTYEVLPLSEIDQALSETDQAEPAKRCTEKSCAIKIGKTLEADYVIYGVIGHIGKLYSLDTAMVDVDKGKIVNTAVTDIEGKRDQFANEAPPQNIKFLLGLNQAPSVEQTSQPEQAASPQPRPAADAKPVKEKNLQIGPRLGLGYSDDGIEVGIGVETRYNNLSLKILGNDIGFAGSLSYYIHVYGNSPYASIIAGYYDDDPHGIDEIGRVYGALFGYRINFLENMDACLGLGAAYFNWDQTEAPMKDDTEIAPIGELTLGYMF